MSGDPATDPELLCYNKGCGKAFKESENTPTSCTFHPGEPFFHDAYKGWNCCNRKCIDFTEFLNMKGCATSFHSNIKPPESKKSNEEVQVEDEKKVIDEETNVPARPPIVAMDRPDLNSPMIDITQELAPNLKKFVSEQHSKPLVDMECQNSGCKVKQSEMKSNPICKHHPGQAIFHEGLKYWSCCNKKAIDFDDFLKQVGCKEGEHCWIPKAVVDCRIDWHQTSTNVIVTIYAKGYDHTQVKIRANGVKLSVDVSLPTGKYIKEWILAGIIENESSIALLQTTKIEVKLKKAEPVQWARLELDSNMPKNFKIANSGTDKNENEEITSGVDAVDLEEL